MDVTRLVRPTLAALTRSPQFYACVVVFTIGLLAFQEAQNFRGSASPFPRGIGVALCALAALGMAAELVRSHRLARPEPAVVPHASTTEEPAGEPAATTTHDPGAVDAQEFSVGKTLYQFGWLACYVAAIGIIGFYLATAIFLTAYFTRVTRVRWRFLVVAVASTLVLLYLLGRFVGFAYPQGLVFSH